MVMLALYTVAKLGKADKTTDKLSRLLCKEPISFSQFVEDYNDVWV